MAIPAILISGIPGTGKSSYALWLAETHGFKHIDLENDPLSLNSFTESQALFIADMLSGPSPVCVDWGFPPRCLPIVGQFSDAGFALWWFDADVAVAKHSFLQRGTVSEAAFDKQISLIAASRTQILQGIRSTHSHCHLARGRAHAPRADIRQDVS